MASGTTGEGTGGEAEGRNRGAAGWDFAVVEERREPVVANIYIRQRQKDRVDCSPLSPVCLMNGYKSILIASI